MRDGVVTAAPIRDLHVGAVETSFSAERDDEPHGVIQPLHRMQVAVIEDVFFDPLRLQRKCPNPFRRVRAFESWVDLLEVEPLLSFEKEDGVPEAGAALFQGCLLYTSPSPRD